MANENYYSLKITLFQLFSYNEIEQVINERLLHYRNQVIISSRISQV